jgi:hypothetical protein
MIQVFLPILIVLVASTISARSGYVPAECGSLDLRKLPVGQGCNTSKGRQFILMHRSASGKEAWMDSTTTIVWGDKLTERIRRRAAKELCGKVVPEENSFGNYHLSELPTLDDFKAAEANGFREVLPNMEDHFYWADSSVPGAKNIGHIFNGSLGKPEIVVYRSINFENVRCIERSRLKKK